MRIGLFRFSEFEEYLKKEAPTWSDNVIEKLYIGKDSMNTDNISIPSSSFNLKTESNVNGNLSSIVTFDRELKEKVKTKTKKSEKSYSNQSLNIIYVVD